MGAENLFLSDYVHNKRKGDINRERRVTHGCMENVSTGFRGLQDLRSRALRGTCQWQKQLPYVLVLKQTFSTNTCNVGVLDLSVGFIFISDHFYPMG